MKIEIPKIVKPLALAGYAEEFGEQTLGVWVNPPRELLHKYTDCAALIKRLDEQINLLNQSKAPEEEITRLQGEAEEVRRQLAEWYSIIWSQGDTPISTQEVISLFDAAQESDPGFQTWLISHTWEMIGGHREGRKKV